MRNFIKGLIKEIKKMILVNLPFSKITILKVNPFQAERIYYRYERKNDKTFALKSVFFSLQNCASKNLRF